MKTNDFLLLVVALRDAQNRKCTPPDIPDAVQGMLDLEEQVDWVIKDILDGKEKLE